MLFYAEIRTFEHKLHSEIERIDFFDKMPENLTYPDIQPILIKEFSRRKMEYKLIRSKRKTVNCL